MGVANMAAVLNMNMMMMMIMMTMNTRMPTASITMLNAATSSPPGTAWGPSAFGSG